VLSPLMSLAVECGLLIADICPLANASRVV